ncbi:MAG: MATE family efflux transporter, partial [Pseudomonadota bacterium]
MQAQALTPRERRAGLVERVRGVVGLSIPLALAQLGQIGMITTDVVMVGWLGALELAAMSLGNAAEHVCLLFVFGIANASAPLIANALGAR